MRVRTVSKGSSSISANISAMLDIKKGKKSLASFRSVILSTSFYENLMRYS